MLKMNLKINEFNFDLINLKIRYLHLLFNMNVNYLQHLNLNFIMIL